VQEPTLRVAAALVLAVWGLIHPQAPAMPEARAIADAWAAAVLEDPLPPVFRTKREDLGIGAVWALRESWLRSSVVGDGGKSFGVWQLQTDAGRGPLLTQARAWLVLQHDGARTCPESPAAPLSGGCKVRKARQLADQRVRYALRLLEQLSEEASP
jgi:hypothetical protein